MKTLFIRNEIEERVLDATLRFGKRKVGDLCEFAGGVTQVVEPVLDRIITRLGGIDKPLLEWRVPDGYTHQEALLHFGTPGTDDWVEFTLEHRPTCYRRGQWRLMVRVTPGENHEKWGCFDDADQPERYYHSEATAKSEAEAIAQVLYEDRKKRG